MARREIKEQKKHQAAAGVLPRVCSMGVSIWDPFFAERFHTSTEHEFIHILDGKTALHDGAGKRRGRRPGVGDTMLLKKGTVHRDEFLHESSLRVFHVLFKWNGYGDVIPRGINAKLALIPAAEKREIREMVNEMYKLFQSDRLFTREMINASLYNLLLYCAGAVRKGLESGRSGRPAEEKRLAVVEEAKRYIVSQFSRPLSLADIAGHLRLSEYYVSHIFSRETGFTFSSYVTQVRMERAAELLRELNNNIAEVADRVGYGNQAYFGKVFYKYFNCTPSQYRANILKAGRRKPPATGN